MGCNARPHRRYRVTVHSSGHRPSYLHPRGQLPLLHPCATPCRPGTHLSHGVGEGLTLLLLRHAPLSWRDQAMRDAWLVANDATCQRTSRMGPTPQPTCSCHCAWPTLGLRRTPAMYATPASRDIQAASHRYVHQCARTVHRAGAAQRLASHGYKTPLITTGSHPYAALQRTTAATLTVESRAALATPQPRPLV